MSEKKNFIRSNVIYRSLRRSSSRVAYSLKKKVTNVHKTMESSLRHRKALQPLNESFSPHNTPNRFNMYEYRNDALSVTPLASSSVVCSVVSPSPGEAKKMPSRLSKQLARCRIWEIQSPKRCGSRPIPKRLQVEVNELARGLQELHAVAEKAQQTAAKST